MIACSIVQWRDRKTDRSQYGRAVAGCDPLARTDVVGLEDVSAPSRLRPQVAANGLYAVAGRTRNHFDFQPARGTPVECFVRFNRTADRCELSEQPLGA